MHKNIQGSDLTDILRQLEEWGLEAYIAQFEHRSIISIANKVHSDFDIRKIALLKGVVDVYRVDEPYKLASRTWKKNSTCFEVKGVTVGAEELNIIAGPCSIESEEHIFEMAALISKEGVKFIRGGAFKPRTSPYSFQGLGIEGLKMIRKAADTYDLRVVTEIMDASQIDDVCLYADIVQVGTRNMQNFYLLKQLGKINKPVLLKRGMSAQITEWLMAAEYILSGGNEKVILCERGIRTFDHTGRNTLDVSAIPIVHELSHLPIFADPSHGTGNRNRVIPMSLASVAAGADGLMIEVHSCPEKALSDGPQALYPEQFMALMTQLRALTSVLQNKHVREPQKNTIWV
ncbi:MAG: 3-deoxy-7-phosphoheptulonate synthase [Bacteroidia bacterium]|nr:3-deoxy-7-phosphoheptulonate synthase [Bacteroidia bacterium]